MTEKYSIFNFQFSMLKKGPTDKSEIKSLAANTRLSVNLPVGRQVWQRTPVQMKVGILLPSPSNYRMCIQSAIRGLTFRSNWSNYPSFSANHHPIATNFSLRLRNLPWG